jgi:thiol-disulfide isomerase/thioredoxin
MFKIIISLFYLIYFFSGCENRYAYDNIIKKLKEQNKQNEQNSTIIIKNENKVIEKEDIKIKQTKAIQASNKIPQKEMEEKFVNKEEETKIEKKITNLELKTANNDTIKLYFQDDGISFEKYKNKIVILDIFTTWCPPCIESIPHLNQLQKQYKKDLQIIGILMEEDKKNSEVLAFKKKYNIKYPITNSKENFTLVDTWGGVSGYPTIIIFDKNGKYFNHFNGSPPIEMLESDIKKALRK